MKGKDFGYGFCVDCGVEFCKKSPNQIKCPDHSFWARYKTKDTTEIEEQIRFIEEKRGIKEGRIWHIGENLNNIKPKLRKYIKGYL